MRVRVVFAHPPCASSIRSPALRPQSKVHSSPTVVLLWQAGSGQVISEPLLLGAGGSGASAGGASTSRARRAGAVSGRPLDRRHGELPLRVRHVSAIRARLNRLILMRGLERHDRRRAARNAGQRSRDSIFYPDNSPTPPSHTVCPSRTGIAASTHLAVTSSSLATVELSCDGLYGRPATRMTPPPHFRGGCPCVGTCVD